jgi:hypothetical protein
MMHSKRWKAGTASGLRKPRFANGNTGKEGRSLIYAFHSRIPEVGKGAILKARLVSKAVVELSGLSGMVGSGTDSE